MIVAEVGWQIRVSKPANRGNTTYTHPAFEIDNDEAIALLRKRSAITHARMRE
jgi:hypothetical protein